MDKMVLTFVVAKIDGRKTKNVVEIPIAESLKLSDLRKFWEFEQFVNNLPTPARLHVDMQQSDS